MIELAHDAASSASAAVYCAAPNRMTSRAQNRPRLRLETEPGEGVPPPRRAHAILAIDALPNLCDNRDFLDVGIRAIRLPLRLAFIGRLRQAQPEAARKPDFPQEILIDVTMKDEPW